MYMHATKLRWSVEDVWALPDEPGKRYETVDGELLVTPSPRTLHQIVLGEIHAEMHAFLRDKPGLMVLMAPSDVVLDEFTLVQPDLYVMQRTDDWRTRKTVDQPTPLLAVEVLSPSTSRQDRFVKRQRYQRDGIECWLVDIDAGLIERWLPRVDRPELSRDVLEWHAPGAPSSLRLDVAVIMRQARGDA